MTKNEKQYFYTRLELLYYLRKCNDMNYTNEPDPHKKQSYLENGDIIQTEITILYNAMRDLCLLDVVEKALDHGFTRAVKAFHGDNYKHYRYKSHLALEESERMEYFDKTRDCYLETN